MWALHTAQPRKAVTVRLALVDPSCCQHQHLLEAVLATDSEVATGLDWCNYCLLFNIQFVSDLRPVQSQKFNCPRWRIPFINNDYDNGMLSRRMFYICFVSHRIISNVYVTTGIHRVTYLFYKHTDLLSPGYTNSERRESFQSSQTLRVTSRPYTPHSLRDR